MFAVLLYFFLFFVILPLTLFPLLANIVFESIGNHLRRKTAARRDLLLARVAKERTQHEAERSGHSQSENLSSIDEGWEKIETKTPSPPAEGQTTGQPTTEEWKGTIGFFHPFCNAGGGGERVLWAAIKATQQRWPNATCVVYTGDHEVDRAAILSNVKERFNIDIYRPTVHFLYLSTRVYVLSTTWPHFTLLGQSLGSLILAYDAFTLLVPDIFIDTMGYAFTLALCKRLFPDVPVGAYVHYPTISTDMLSNLSTTGQGLNAGSGAGVRGTIKKLYWKIFAWMYSWVGGHVDVVMTNSTWTKGHIRQLWGRSRLRSGRKAEIAVVFPPCPVEELERKIPIDEESEKSREKILLYIAQFRPEKNHALILESFAKYLETLAPSSDTSSPSQLPRLVLIGSVRDSDDATRVYKLRLLAHELKIKDNVEFVCDASWVQILDWLRRAWVGVNGMWNEHFGIGVVEYISAGLICVVHDSGGPKFDICVPIDGKATGPL